VDRDYEFVKKIPYSINLGLIQIDTTEVKDHIIKNIELAKEDALIAINKGFYTLLYEGEKKFDYLKTELLTSASNIEGYIALKNFLEGEDLQGQIEEIGTDVDLCKKLDSIKQVYRIRHERDIYF